MILSAVLLFNKLRREYISFADHLHDVKAFLKSAYVDTFHSIDLTSFEHQLAWCIENVYLNFLCSRYPEVDPVGGRVRIDAYAILF